VHRGLGKERGKGGGTITKNPNKKKGGVYQGGASDSGGEFLHSAPTIKSRPLSSTSASNGHGFGMGALARKKKEKIGRRPGKFQLQLSWSPKIRGAILRENRKRTQ